jgi:hypothetical protein
MRPWRRVRGLLLRVVLKRPLAVSLGCAIAAPGLLIVWRDYAWETGVTDGLALLALASGAALAYAGLSGRRPDWHERSVPQRTTNNE